jgi:hypothetical protein
VRRRARRSRLLGAAALASLLCTGGCSLILDFDESADAGPTIDGGVVDGPTGDGGDPCAEFEPNNSLQTAASIEAGVYGPLGICPTGDADFFSFTVDGAQDVLVQALFTNAPSMDLEMRMYDGTGQVIDRSETFDSNESIERSSAMGNILAAGSYFVEVFGFNNTDTNTYTLDLAITAP